MSLRNTLLTGGLLAGALTTAALTSCEGQKERIDRVCQGTRNECAKRIKACLATVTHAPDSITADECFNLIVGDKE